MRANWAPLTSTPGFLGTWSAGDDPPGPERARAGDYYALISGDSCGWRRYSGVRQVATSYRHYEWTPFVLHGWLGLYQSLVEVQRLQSYHVFSIAGIEHGMFVAHRVIRDDGPQAHSACPLCRHEIADRRGGLNPYSGVWTCDECRLDGSSDGQQRDDALDAAIGLISAGDGLQLDDLEASGDDEFALEDAPPATTDVLQWLQDNENATLRSIVASQYTSITGVIEAVYWLIRNGYVDFTIPPDTRFSARSVEGMRVDPMPEPPVQPSGKRKKIVV